MNLTCFDKILAAKSNKGKPLERHQRTITSSKLYTALTVVANNLQVSG